MHVLFHTPRHLSKGKIESPCQDIIAMVFQTKFFLTKLLRDMRPGVLPVTPNQRDRVLNGF